MAYEKRDNSGTLSRNTKKVTVQQPDHRGRATIDGVDYWISAWVKEGEYGRFFSLAFQRQDEADKAQVRRTGAEFNDDDIPF